MTDPENTKKVYSLKDVIDAERSYLKNRRKKLNNGEYKEEMDNLFGLALSGGGIRSAIVNLGFLKYLNEQGILKRADYISTVSGGGYTGAFIQATLLNADQLREQSPVGSTEETEKKEVKESLISKENPYPFDELFREDRIKHLISHGNYMAPGFGIKKKWNNSLLGFSYVSSLLMSWIGPILAILSLYFLYVLISNNFDSSDATFGAAFLKKLFRVSVIGLVLLLLLHFLANIRYNYNLGISLFLDKLKVWFVFIVLVLLTGYFIARLVNTYQLGSLGFEKNEMYIIGAIFLLFIAGFFANPNSLSLHRYYRKRLADAFLSSGGKFENSPLHKMADIEGSITKYAAPYPLINTCLNLQSGHSDESFQGAKGGDYYLLSPFYSGSKLTGYLTSDSTLFYQQMTLPAAMAISAAAINPGMGSYSSTMLSLMTTLFNLRLGYWVLSPKRIKEEVDLNQLDKREVREEMKSPQTKDRIDQLLRKRELGKLEIEDEIELESLLSKKHLLRLKSFGPVVLFLRKLVWWPKYFIYELFSGINTKHRMLNISDGGHIENLAVFELLRRRCKLIIGVDSGADPKFSFADLQNLMVRARNELGIEIRFRKRPDTREYYQTTPVLWLFKNTLCCC